jgi:4-hydroxybenzoate polyprenyltransferase
MHEVRESEAADSLPPEQVASWRGTIRSLRDVFRPLRWYRNLSMLLGALLTIKVSGLGWAHALTQPPLRSFLLSLAALCLVASANYGLNEVLDTETDRHHPRKQFRAIPAGRISPRLVLLLSLALYLAGLGIIARLHNPMLTLSLALLALSGFLYNVRPFRLKDRPYLDFSFEALNNPIRLMVGWYSLTPAHIPIPASFVLSFWFLGCFLMAAKRFGELRFLADRQAAARYRRSLRFYTEERLLSGMICALVAFSFMLGFFCLKYGVDTVLVLPFVLVWTVWFFSLAYQEDTIVKDPERLFEKKGFLGFSVLSLAAFFYLFYTGNQFLGWIK